MIFSFEQNEKNYVRNSWAIKTAKPHNHRNNFRNWNATEKPGVPSWTVNHLKRISINSITHNN